MEVIAATPKHRALSGVVLCLAIIAAYMGLMPAGHWQPDEYTTFKALREGDLGFLAARITSWSPRPLSEFLIYLYAQAVQAWDRPLIGQVLALLWLTLVACAATPALVAEKTRRLDMPSSLLGSLTLLCMFLLGHPVSEIFYWPMASLAYLPTLAAITLIHGLSEHADLKRPRTRAITLVALVVAALSTEVGAMFVLAYTVASFAAMIHPVCRGHGARPFHGLMLPLAVSVIVLYAIVNGRVSANSEMFGTTTHQFWPSVFATMPHAAWELVSADSLTIDARHLLFGAITKLAFFVGIFCLSRRSTPHGARQRTRALLALAAFAMVPITLFTAYYQFGSMVCCERHATFRQCMVFIGLASSASFLAGLRPNAGPSERYRRMTGEIALLLALAIGLAGSTGRLVHDYANFTALLSNHDRTWQSGRSNDKTMTVIQMPYGGIVGGYPILDANLYSRDGHEPHAATVILDYFGKDSATFTTHEGR